MFSECLEMRSWASCLTILYFGMMISSCGSSEDFSSPTGAAPESASGSVQLTAVEVQTIIAQAATQAQALNFPVTIAVLDHEGTPLGLLRMAGARADIRIRGGGAGGSLEGQSLANIAVPSIQTAAAAAAISKAGTAARFGTQGFALSTRTTNFVLQERFPPQVSPAPGGPLLGVQFSQLRCSDIDRTGHLAADIGLPLGLSADPGGLPLYKNGVAVGGIGVEGDGIYTLDKDASDRDQPFEEIIAVAGTLGFAAPAAIRSDRILVDGFALPFANVDPPARQNTIPYATIAAAPATEIVVPINSPPSGFVARNVGGVDGFVDPLSSPVPFIGGTDGGLTAAEVERIIGQAAQQAVRTRSALRFPLGLPARMSITVVDSNGVILGMFRNVDAPIESWDISAQKARTANFFTRADAATVLNANFSSYVQALAAVGIPLNGSTAFTSRAIGFLSYPFFPPGETNPTLAGVLAKPPGQWSIFNIGLQTDLLNIGNVLSGARPCTNLGPLGTNPVPNGIQLFPQGVPLYKNGVHVGALGVSGDGADQDDIVPTIGSAGFEAPEAIRSDLVVIGGVKLPFSVFPRNPNLF